MLKNLNQLAKRTLESEEFIRNTWDASKLAKLTFTKGLLTQMDLGKDVTVFIHHEEVTVSDKDAEGKIVERKASRAYAITCSKPVTYGKLVNSAVHQEYDVENGEIEAINRKGRQDAKDADVKMHDKFVAWVKDGLKKIGIN